MNKAIANMIRDTLTDIPFIELFGGLVYTQVKAETFFKNEYDETGKEVEYKFPVTCDYVGKVDCDHKGLKDFIPDSNLKGMLYFEDNGIIPTSQGKVIGYTSRLRLIVWLNSKYVDGSPCIGISTPIMNGILERLIGKNPFNYGDFQRVVYRIDTIPPANIDLFRKYTYKESQLQFLMPPFEYFAIDILTDFRVNPECLNYLLTKTPSACS